MAHIKQLLADGEAALTDSDSAQLDAELLLACALDTTRTWLYTWPEHVPALPQQHLYLEMLRRRCDGEPVVYLVGRREFWGLELKVDKRVLIPRPETELLVEAVLEKLSGQEEARVADLGTGSGAIALALASSQPGWQMVATDSSEDALDLARDNAEFLGIHTVEFYQCRKGQGWTAPLAGQSFTAIVSNPPYVKQGDPHLTRGDVRFEPVQALVAVDNGLADIRAIIAESPGCLHPGGWLLLEHGFDQGAGVRKIFTEAGFTEIETRKDLAGHERATFGRMKG